MINVYINNYDNGVDFDTETASLCFHSRVIFVTSRNELRYISEHIMYSNYSHLMDLSNDSTASDFGADVDWNRSTFDGINTTTLNDRANTTSIRQPSNYSTLASPSNIELIRYICEVYLSNVHLATCEYTRTCACLRGLPVVANRTGRHRRQHSVSDGTLQPRTTSTGANIDSHPR